MSEASLQGFLRTILIIILAYYVLTWLGRILFPVLFQKAVKNMEKKVREQQGYQYQHEDVKEGETVIDKKPRQGHKEDGKKVGEYVDYEEIDD